MFAALRKLASQFFSAVGKEADVLEELHGDVQAALERMEARDPGLKELLKDAHGYAVFPSVGKATAVIGGAFGKGEVFEQGKMVGYAGVGQLTVGVQFGGQTFSEVIAFQDEAALDRFKGGRWAFAANASAALVKAGAAAAMNYQRGVAVFVSSEGGMMLEAAIGAQKFYFRPAVLGRSKAVQHAATSTSAAAKRQTPRAGRAAARATSKRTPGKSAANAKSGSKRRREPTASPAGPRKTARQ